MGDESNGDDVLDNKTEAERAQYVLDLLDRVETALDGLPHPHKVLTGLKYAAIYSIANGVEEEQFLGVATQVFQDARNEVALYAQRRLGEDPPIPDAEVTP